MPTTLDFPANIAHRRHVLTMLDLPGVYEPTEIDWQARTVTFPDDYPQNFIDIATERFGAYDPTQTELDMLATYIANSPIVGMTPLEAHQFLTSTINNINSLAAAKNVLAQILPVLVAFMLYNMRAVRDDDRL